MFLIGETVKLPKSGATVKVTELSAHCITGTSIYGGAIEKLPLTAHDYTPLLTTRPVGTAQVSQTAMGATKIAYVLPNGDRAVLTNYGHRRNWTLNSKPITAAKLWAHVHLGGN